MTCLFQLRSLHATLNNLHSNLALRCTKDIFVQISMRTYEEHALL